LSRNLDTIRRGLAEVWDSQGRRFVTFEVEGGSGPDADRWVQYLDGELNVRWPLDEEPAAALRRRRVALPPGAFVSWHVANENALFGVGDVLLDDLAPFIEKLFAEFVADDARFRLVSRVDTHG
jgi:hypothetical protein